MKKIVNVLKISVVLIFICHTSKAQEKGNKVQELPAYITQKRIEPSYKMPESDAAAVNIKPDLSLQTKPAAQQSNSQGNTQKDEEITKPVALKATPGMANPVSTIDTKTNTDKYYNQKPVLPVEPPKPVNKQPVIQKPAANQVPVVVE